MAKEFKLRDISEYNGELEIDFLQRKISAAGEMKTAIKKYLDTMDDMFCGHCNCGDDIEAKTARLRKAMEAYLNVK